MSQPHSCKDEFKLQDFDDPCTIRLFCRNLMQHNDTEKRISRSFVAHVLPKVYWIVLRVMILIVPRIKEFNPHEIQSAKLCLWSVGGGTLYSQFSGFQRRFELDRDLHTASSRDASSLRSKTCS